MSPAPPLPSPRCLAAETIQMFAEQTGSWRIGLGLRTRPSFASHLHSALQDRMWVVSCQLLEKLGSLTTLPKTPSGLETPQFRLDQSYPIPFENTSIHSTHAHTLGTHRHERQHSHVPVDIHGQFSAHAPFTQSGTRSSHSIIHSTSISQTIHRA